MRPSSSARRRAFDVQQVAYSVEVHNGRHGNTGIECLAGDYFENWENHSHAVYTKRIQPESKDTADNVTLYYWDERDGEKCSGWWFGNGIAGQRVWSRNPSNARTPPATGWLAPWDGVTIPGLLSVKRQISVSCPYSPNDWCWSWNEVARSCSELGRLQIPQVAYACLGCLSSFDRESLLYQHAISIGTKHHPSQDTKRRWAHESVWGPMPTSWLSTRPIPTRRPLPAPTPMPGRRSRPLPRAGPPSRPPRLLTRSTPSPLAASGAGPFQGEENSSSASTDALPRSTAEFTEQCLNLRHAPKTIPPNRTPSDGE